MQDLLDRLENSIWIVVPLLIVAAGLRFHDLDLQSLWFDELMTWTRSDQPTFAAMIASVREDVWPPGHPMAAFVWMKAVGSSEFLLRYPAALAGVLFVAAIYRLGRDLLGGRGGLYAALLAAVVQVTIYYSQEARPYAALLLYTTLSMLFWLRIMRALHRDERPNPVALVGYALTALLILYYNYFGSLLVALQGIGALAWHIRQPRRWPAFFALYAVIAVGYLPWLPETLRDLQRDTYFLTSTQSVIVELLTYFHFLLNMRPPWVDAMNILFGVVVGVELWRALRLKEEVRWDVWAILLLWLLLPFAITYGYSTAANKSLLVNRYLLIGAPAYYLLLAWMAGRLPLPRGAVTGVMAAAGLVLVYHLVYGWDYYNRVTKAQFREAAALVVETDPDLTGDSLIIGFTGHPNTETHFDYYFEQMGSARRVQAAAGWATDAGPLAALVAEEKPDYVWLVTAFTPPADEVLAALDESHDPVRQEAYYSAWVWLWEAEEVP
ncbi:MAG: glycosyltransferase family 39 protein [Anaerolineae bacterium]